MEKANYDKLSRMVQLRISLRLTVKVVEKSHNSKGGHPETVDNVLKDYAFSDSVRGFLRETSPIFDPRTFLNSNQGIKVVAKFLDSVSYITNK